MKIYKNTQTGLVLVVDGPVICVSEPRQGRVEMQMMNFGEAAFAEALGESLAKDLGAKEEKHAQSLL